MYLTTILKKINLLFVLKTGFGSAIAILLANSLGLLYSPSAGIITLLTIQSTKRETIQIAGRRVVAFIIASFLSYVLFEGIGYTPASFGLFVFFFVALCYVLHLKDAIAMNSVLMTHFLIERRFDPPLLFNELGLLAIGMGIGIILNLIMPKNKEKINQEQLLLEEEIRSVLRGLSRMLRNKDACLVQDFSEAEVPQEYEYQKEELDIAKLETMLERLLQRAYEELGNTLLSDTRYQVSYLEMRKQQIGVLKAIRENIASVPVILKQTFPLALFMEQIADSFHERNNVIELLKEFKGLKEYFRNEKLPQSREEFEYRATLFQILKELEYFLSIKRDFVIELEEQNLLSYWN